MNLTNEDLIKQILDHFGSDSQILKTIEELNECAARLAKDIIDKHIAQKSSLFDKTIEEIADATIMLRQMRILYGAECVDKVIENKLHRTISRITEGNRK